MKLPSKFEKTNIIGKMKVGDIGYVTPWVMVVDSNRDCWLALNSEYSDQPGGTVQLKIKRLENGFKAYIYAMRDEYKWVVPESTPKRTKPVDTGVVGYVVEFDDESFLSSLKKLI